MNTEKAKGLIEEGVQKAIKNTPYVKAHDASGDLINPILFKYAGLGPNRRERRKASGVTSTRPFSNKKGINLVVTQIGLYSFIRFEKKVIQQGSNTRLQMVERFRKA